MNCSRGLVAAQKSSSDAMGSSFEVNLPSAEPFESVEIPLRVQAELGRTGGGAGYQQQASKDQQMSLAEHRVSGRGVA